MKKSAENLMGISGSVPVSLHEAMENARWGYKKNMSQFVRLAVESFAVSEGFWTPDELDKSALTPDQLAAVEADETRAAEADAAAKAEADAAAKAEADAAAKAAEGVQDDPGTDAESAKTEDDAAADEQPTKPASRSRK